MAIERVVSTESLADDECNTLAPALAKRLALSLPGRLRYLFELVTGTSPVDDGGGTPLNPDGRIGANRSGDPWGDCFEHPVWVSEGSGGGSVFGNRDTLTMTVAGSIEVVPAVFAMRPYARRQGTPYSRLKLCVYARRIGGSGTAILNVRVFGDEVGTGPSQSGTITMASSLNTFLTTAVYASTQSGPGLLTRRIEVELDPTSTAGANVYAMSLNQVVARSHF